MKKQFTILLILFFVIPVIVKASSIRNSVPLIISDVSATPITTSSINIRWTTNHGSNSQVEYGLSEDYGNLTAVTPNERVTEHSQTITGLNFSDTYHYRVISHYDLMNNISDDYTFSLSNFSWPAINSADPQTLTSIDDIITIYGEGFNQGDNRYLKCDDLSNNLGLTNITWTDTSVQFKFDKNDWHYYLYPKENYKCKIQVAVGDAPDYFSNEIDVYVKLTPECKLSDWSCTNWNSCSSSGTQTRTCSKISNCGGGVSAPITSQSCAYTPACTANSWSCGDWGTCSSNGIKSRTCDKISNCEGGTQSPATAQSCTYTPPCSADTWQCGNWGTCSPQGVQTRSCNKTFDCPSAETASPATSQYCQTSNTTPRPSNTTSEPTININREQIIKATVKLKCPIDKQSAWLGTGTIIDQYGTILTNRHVVDGSIGVCRVGFINNESDIPNFSEIADVKKVSSDQSLNGDMAILKIRNNSNKKFTAIDISLGNSDSLKSGDYILPFGYPREEEFGEAITFTEGPYSGSGTSVIISRYKYDVSKFFKTTAVIEHGNSGGGAYQKRTGYYMGIPTLGFEKVNYILSANYINQWIGSFDRNYSVGINNFSNISNYYKETIPIENIDLNMLKELDSSTNLLNQTSSEASATESEIVVEQEKSLVTKIDEKLSKRVSGNILLQVESKGEGWYVNPDNKKKYYLGKPADAFSIMRNLGLGIKHSELESYLNKKFPIRLAGKIMLDVEKKGEAYYVNPKDLKGYFLNKPSDAFQVMRNLGLGITNTDIRKIEVGETE